MKNKTESDRDRDKDEEIKETKRKIVRIFKGKTEWERCRQIVPLYLTHWLS